jgi:hypothetical protein
MVNAPLTRVARAAERVGLDINAPILAERGPAQLQRVIRAFNDMQRRLPGALDRTFGDLGSRRNDRSAGSHARQPGNPGLCLFHTTRFALVGKAPSVISEQILIERSPSINVRMLQSKVRWITGARSSRMRFRRVRCLRAACT